MVPPLFTPTPPFWFLTALVCVTLGSGTQAGAQATPVNFHRPIWSPDGTSIVVMAYHEEDWELYTMRLDGSHVERLTEHQGWDGYASISPDGRSLVFDRADDAGRRLTGLDLATGRTWVIAQSATDLLGGGRWSPDGRRIVFQWEQNENRDLHSAAPDGSDLRRITATPVSEGDFGFSPDGSAVAVAVRDGDTRRVEVLHLATGARRTVVGVTGNLYGVDWSPDGSLIAYNADTDGDHEIYVVPAAGGTPRQLTDNEVTDHLPVWSPDSARLIYTTEQDEREVVMVMDRNGGYAIRVGLRLHRQQ